MSLLAPQPYQFIADNMSLSDIKDLCDALGVRFDNLGGVDTPREKARELQQYMIMNRRLGDLLEGVGLYRTHFESKRYVYLMLMEHVDADGMASLCRELELDCAGLGLTAAQLKPYDLNPHFRRTTARLLHRTIVEQDRLNELLEALARLDPQLNLRAFDSKKSSEPPPHPPSEKTEAAIPAADLKQYENFDLRIGAAYADGYPIEVLHSPEGQVMPVKQQFQLEDQTFAAHISYLQQLVARPLDAVELGKMMRRLLFPGEVWSKFRESLTSVRGRGKGLRLRLRIDPPELGGLPWEYCFDDAFDFLAHSSSTPFVRFPAESLAAAELEADYPIRILLVTADAHQSGRSSLNLDKEVGYVREALAPLEQMRLAEVKVLSQATVSTMSNALQDGRYHVLHFLGHGSIDNGEGSLVLIGDDGTEDRVGAAQLRAMLRSSSVKVVYLNACSTAVYGVGANPISSVALSLVRAGVPAVIAMQQKVPDKTALLFSRELYRSLAQGKPLDLAVTEMRRAAYINEGDMVYWGIPVLYMRSADGIIWQASPQVAAQLAAYQAASE